MVSAVTNKTRTQPSAHPAPEYHGHGMILKSKIKNTVKKVVKELKALGYKYYCPVCSNKVDRFLPLEEIYADALIEHKSEYSIDRFETLNIEKQYCPHCKSTDRERLYALYLDRFMDLAESSVLDIAPSGGLRNLLKKKSKNYRCTDFFKNDVDDKLDVCDMHLYPDNTFDFLVCSHVLEHVPDDAKAMKELHRVLRPGGKGIVMVPIYLDNDNFDEDPTLEDEGERWRRFAQLDHIRMYNQQTFINRLQGAHFEIQMLRNKDFSEYSFSRLGLSQTSTLYVVTKN